MEIITFESEVCKTSALFWTEVMSIRIRDGIDRILRCEDYTLLFDHAGTSRHKHCVRAYPHFYVCRLFQNTMDEMPL